MVNNFALNNGVGDASKDISKSKIVDEQNQSNSSNLSSFSIDKGTVGMAPEE
jgi:hypothetical protein